ncbi:CaiB/BaiF CoA-transferase family protein [Arthrobacter sp. 08Y14]|uniref:CaiB/BaiF CoA transferase family protein n=1 Tax=Arthrobacter sp. 08Y14 TaxID=2058885 RepID=UPI000CE43388|nr:CaiB/BaiF CoA-transferase family protein [Arthrobacter sp. 08Y14]
MPGPLEGVRVLALAGLGPGPFASMLLADLGADVVRVDRPPHRLARALGQTAEFTARQDVVNRGTRSIALDLKSSEGVSRVLELAAEADVFMEGFRPGVTERLGLGPEALLQANARIVYSRLTGFGQDSEFAATAGHDINYLAESGALHSMGGEGLRPKPPLNLLGDYAGGGLLAAFGIVSAVLRARTTGEGQVVDAGMVDGVALLTAKLQGLRAAGLLSDLPGTNFIDSGAPFYDTYKCSDGRYLAVGALESDFYRQFLSGLGVDTDGWPDQNDESSWPELRRRISEAVKERTMREWAGIFDSLDACVSPVLTFDEAAQRHHKRGLYAELDGALQPAPAPRFSRTPARPPATPDENLLDVGELLASWRRS